MTINRLAFALLTLAFLAAPGLMAGEGAEADLTKMKKGGTKVIETGEMKVTAERDGDTVHLTIKNPDGKTKKMDIDIDDAGVAVVKMGEDGGERHIIIKTIAGDGEGSGRFVVSDDDEEVVSVGSSSFRFSTGDLDDGKTLLRCPEGDTTMRVDDKDANATFLCPKHKVKLVPAKERRKQVLVFKTEVDDDE